MSTSKNWWKAFFEENIAEMFLERNPREVEEAARFLAGRLRLKKGDLVFDQCSGIGNISHALARRGYRTVGVEQSGPYVRRARQAAEREDLDCVFQRGNALRFVPERRADGAFNWYTSFGYFQDDSANLKMLERAFQSLKPGGRFALDFHNPLYILRGRTSERRYVKKIGGKTVHVVRTSWVDLEKGALTSEWRYHIPGRPVRTLAGTTRLYMPVDLKRLLERAGFLDLRFFGATDGRPLSAKSPRCIIVARKPL